MGWKEDYDNKYLYIIPNSMDYQPIYDENKWITVDHRVLYIKDMTTNHIKNCINMINRDCEVVSITPIRYKVYNNLLHEYFKRK